MSIKRFNPTLCRDLVWYIMSPVGTRGLSGLLGCLDVWAQQHKVLPGANRMTI